ncbi:MAG TPA: envelope integrity protein Cei [Pseudonocardiaceae bacterium]|nr:envelope integrity protein Cei [Pseudonocardiaceae bacterium]
MVSGGLTRERGKALYRKRKPIPAVIIVVVLGIAAVVVWTKVIARASDVDAAVACPPAASASTTPTAAAKPTPKPAPKTKSADNLLPYNALDKIAPEPAADIKIQVLNASTQRGAALQATNQLQQDGFQVAAPGNDPVYPAQNMQCRGQIRFGANGESAARTVSLLVPCTQLVRDDRQDSTVDLAIGSDFTGVAPNSQARQAMHELASWAASHPAPKGGQEAQNSVLPRLDASLLAQAHSDEC